MFKREATAVLLGACVLMTACANAPPAIRVNNAQIVNDDIAVEFVLTNIYRKPLCLSLQSFGEEGNDGADYLNRTLTGQRQILEIVLRRHG